MRVVGQHAKLRKLYKKWQRARRQKELIEGKEHEEGDIEKQQSTQDFQPFGELVKERRREEIKAKELEEVTKRMERLKTEMI